MNHWERVTLCAAVVIFVLCRPSRASSCSCVPEALCPAPDVDLRLVDGADECPRGSVCCGATSADQFCDGECVPDGSSNDSDDEYGADLIDVRLVAEGPCPVGYTCRTVSPAERPVCRGTCVARSMCTMFNAGPQSDGCTGGHVCCSMDRTSWTELINDINGMELDGGSSGDRCQWRTEADGSRIPSWLVSVWARVEIIPGFTADQFVCAGALTDARHVLTLASCVEHFDVDDLFVNVGDYDLASRSLLRSANIYSIRAKVIHEDYNSTVPARRNAALLRLDGQARDGSCTVTIAPFDEDHHHHGRGKCAIVGWNRELLSSGRQTGRPRQYETAVESFNEDLFCAPGTICLDRAGARCDDPSLDGSPVLCEAHGLLALRGLLVRNCTGVAVEDLAAWVKHRQVPGFVQVPTPADTNRQYLPPL